MPDDDEDQPFVQRIGPIDVDWARSIGFYGGLAVAVAVEMIVPELALFIALVPLLKLLKRKRASIVEKFGAAVLEGAAKPLGGDAEEAVRPAWQDDEKDAKANGQAKAG